MALELSLQIECDVCGSEVGADFDDKKHIIHIKPCEACMKAEREEGNDAGYKKGYEAGKEESQAQQ